MSSLALFASTPWTIVRRLLCSTFTLGALAGLSNADDVPGKVTSNRRDVLVDVVDRVKSSVVNIHSERTVSSIDNPFRVAQVEPQRVNGMGTGIVIDPRGYLITNHHVIDDVQSLRVRLIDGTSLPAKVLATDKQSDLALVKIDPPASLPLVPIGTAGDLFLAEQVIAIGNAYGYEHTVTVGFVSAKNRDVTLNKDVQYQQLIQTQTPINPGNSGGPLFNKRGELVGVNVAIRAGAQNIAFAIPVDSMITKATDLLASRRKVGLRNGLVVADKYQRDGDEGLVKRWVVVTAVEKDSTAAKAGFKVGDVIDKAGDIPVRTSIDIERSMIDLGLNSNLTFQVKRGMIDEKCTLALGRVVEAPVVSAGVQANGNDAVWKKLGIKATAVGAPLVASVDPQLRGGMYVAEVAAGSAAARAGLVKGDILIGLHLWETLNNDNISFVLNHKDLATFSPIKAHFIRGGVLKQSFVTPE